MIDNIDTNQVQDLAGEPSFKQRDSAKALPNSDADVSLQVNYASFINKAMQIPQTDAEVVQQARELLLSGQPGNPEDIRAAAEDIAEYGI